MHRRLIIILSPQESEALRQVADKQLRGLSDQARYLVRAELQRLGVLELTAENQTHDRAEVNCD